MKQKTNEFLPVFWAAFFGVFVGYTVPDEWRLTQMREPYQQGYQAAMAQTVTVGGGRAGPCKVEISHAALADMVNAGVMRWHEMCEREAAFSEEGGNIDG